MRRVLVVFGVMGAVSCGSSSPTVPSPSSATWRLSGAIRAAGSGAPLPGAIVKILDGPNANMSVVSGADGAYSFTRLGQAGFTVRAEANGYTALEKPVALTGDKVIDFELAKILLANIQPTMESVTGVLQADGTYAVPL